MGRVCGKRVHGKSLFLPLSFVGIINYALKMKSLKKSTLLEVIICKRQCCKMVTCIGCWGQAAKDIRELRKRTSYCHKQQFLICSFSWQACANDAVVMEGTFMGVGGCSSPEPWVNPVRQLWTDQPWSVSPTDKIVSQSVSPIGGVWGVVPSCTKHCCV